MGFNRENKITYKELAPSLQELIDSKAIKSDVDIKITNLTNNGDSYKADIELLKKNMGLHITQASNDINNLNNNINGLNTRITKLESTSSVKVTAGTIHHGGTIPIPNGATREQCKYAVWLLVHSETVDGVDTWVCRVDQTTGVVTATHNDTSGGLDVGYLCIATKN